MKKLIYSITKVFPATHNFNLSLLVFRIAISMELILVHGLKKIGVGAASSEHVPNPLHLPDVLNHGFASAANLLFPILVILGFFTRIAVLPILAVTFTGYLVVHAHDSLLVRDVPFMYSISFLLVLFIGPGKYSIDTIIHKRILK